MLYGLIAFERKKKLRIERDFFYFHSFGVLRNARHGARGSNQAQAAKRRHRHFLIELLRAEAEFLSAQPHFACLFISVFVKLRKYSFFGTANRRVWSAR